MDALVPAMRHNAFDQGIDSFVHSISNEIPIHHDPVKTWTMLQVFHVAVKSEIVLDQTEDFEWEVSAKLNVMKVALSDQAQEAVSLL